MRTSPSLISGCLLLLCFFGLTLPGHGQAPAPREVLQAFSAQAGTLQDLLLPPGPARPFNLAVRLGDRDVKLVLQSYEIRKQNFQLLVQDAQGVKPMRMPAMTTLRGRVAGVRDSLVAATVVNGQLQALIRQQGEVWEVRPCTDVVPAAPAASHFICRGKDLLRPAVSCGCPDPVGQAPAQAPQLRAPATAGASANASMTEAELAIDVDREYYLRNGSSVFATVSAVMAIVNGVDAIYQNDVQIQYKVSSIIIRTTPTYVNTDLTQLLPEFRNRWNSSHQGVQRDIAHLFTGKGVFSGIVGYASVGVVCSQSFGYGVSRVISSLSTNIGLVAHELGHNWSANHCGSPDCRIMCSSLGGCNNDLGSFGLASRTSILNHAASRSCLSAPNSQTLPVGKDASGGNAGASAGWDISNGAEQFHPARVVELFDAETFPWGSSAKTISSLSVRRYLGFPLSNTTAHTKTMRMCLSTDGLPARQPDMGDFDRNHGSNLSLVLGSVAAPANINFPSSGIPSTLPAPFPVNFPFNQPFMVPANTQTLAIEYRSYTPSTTSGTWLADSYNWGGSTSEGASSFTNFISCVNPPISSVHVGSWIGGSYSHRYTTNRPNIPLIAILGTSFNPPLVLPGTGILGCELWVNQLLQYNRTSSAVGGVLEMNFGTIPDTASLIGIGAYHQIGVVDPTVNPLGLGLSRGVFTTVGSGHSAGVLGCRIFSHGLQHSEHNGLPVDPDTTNDPFGYQRANTIFQVQ